MVSPLRALVSQITAVSSGFGRKECTWHIINTLKQAIITRKDVYNLIYRMNYNIYITTAEMIQKRGSNNSLFNKLYALNLPGLSGNYFIL